MLFTAGKASTVAFLLLLRGVWFVGNVRGQLFATSDSGMSNLIIGVLVGSIPNIVFYSMVFFAFGKLGEMIRGRQRNPGLSTGSSA